MGRDYLAKLSRAARWYLPPAEAAEVLEDYRELIEQEPRSEEQLRRDVGTPKDAVGQLVQIRAYQKWLAVFAVLAAGVALPAVSPILNRLFWWNLDNKISQLELVFLLVGILLSFLWFQRNGHRRERLPKSVALLSILPLIWMAWNLFFSVSILYGMDTFTGIFWEHPWVAVMFHWSLILGSLFMGLIGLVGLVEARLDDRRWRAVYVLGLTGTLLSLSIWALLTSMDISFSETGWQTPILMEYIVITVLGLVGTGVSLC